MLNFRKFISVSAVAILGVTTWLTPLSYADAAKNWAELASWDLTANPLQFIMPDHDVYFYAITAANKYFVQYHGNNETSGEMWTWVFTYDTTWHLVPNEFIRTWYTWNSWNTQASGSGQSYSSGAAVWNWTTVESGVEHIYAQWNANTYNISYDLNDSDGTSSWVHPKTPTTWTYDKSLTIQHPSRTWYAFSGWTITNMDTEAHTIGSGTSHSATETEVMATSFANLRATSGTVNFKAIWTKNQHTPYTVEHYLETLTWGYPEMYEDIDNLSWVTDEEVTPDTNTYTWFTAPGKQTVNINADGSTNVRYEYTRNHYDLKLVAGRWIASVSGTGTVTAGDSAGASGSTTISFLYDEPVTVDFVLKSWYTWGTWSGYEWTSESFNMKASSGTKTAYATAIVYNLTYDYKLLDATTPTNPSTYTVESDLITLNNPTGVHSDFLWWTGTDLTWTPTTVTIPNGSTWNRSYTAQWKCRTWYHPKDPAVEGDNYWNCIPDTDTQYTVNHMQQDLDWDYSITWATVIQTWTTDTPTNATEKTFTWFTTHEIGSANISWDGKTVVEITYDRLSYNWTITPTTWVVTSGATGAHPVSGGKYQFEDTVTLTATTGDWYTFSHWTVESNWDPITVNNSGNINGATFQMPAWPVTITPNLTVNVYHITYDLNSWSVAGTNPTTYTVESGNITLINPTRDHSVFKGWSWTDITWLSWTVVIAKWSVWDRSYEAIWWCDAWYHAVDDSCVANEYTVKIDYNDGDHGSAETTGFTYDTTWTIENPSQSWYDFAWWIVTWISGGNATVDGDPITSGSVTSGTEFNNLTTEEGGTVTLTATWTPRNDTKYVVRHYTKDLSGTAYKLEDTIEYSWSVAEPVEISSITTGAYSWFTAPTVWYLSWTTAGPSGSGYAQVTIDKHGTTVINLYYSRNSYNVYLSGDDHVDTLVGSGSYKYGQTVEISATAKAWYHFVRWEKRKSDRSKES